jgi:hypothetical protein
VRAQIARVPRVVLDQLHQLESAPGSGPQMRAATSVPAPLRSVLFVLRRIPRGVRRGLRPPLRAVARRLVWPAPYRGLIARARPDVVLVTPLLEIGSRQPDQLAAARAASVPTALIVHSWDNLTTKGLVHGDPDRVLVWNPAQRREAIELHDVPSSRVHITGSAAWDHWFGMRPTPRREFCRGLGLDPDRPVLTYLCSSTPVAPEEGAVVEQWVEAVRRAPDPRVRGAGILIRCHPGSPLGAAAAALAERDQVAVQLPDVTDPSAPGARQRLYDAVSHADAVVGVNTSAMIESAIVGRPVLTVLRPCYVATQARSRHFRHLVGGDGVPGLVHIARDDAEHVAELSLVLDDRSPDGTADAFVEWFVRPFGRDAPATPRVVEAIEDLAWARTAVPVVRARHSAGTTSCAHRPVQGSSPS